MSDLAEEIRNLRKETIEMKELRQSLGVEGFQKRVVEKVRFLLFLQERERH